LTDHIELGVLARAFPRDLLDEVVEATGCREQRSRRLPAHVMLRFVIAQGLWFGQSAEEVMRLLVGGLVWLGSWGDGWQVPSRSAIAQARARLGAAPMRALFDRVAVPVALAGTKGSWLWGYRLMSIDGTTLDVADTAANEAAFGRSGNDHATSAFPQLRLMTLSEVGTHAVVAAQIGAYRTGERALAGGLVGALDGEMLVLADAGLYSWQLWTQAQASGAQLAWRVGASLGLPVLRELGDGSYLSVLIASKVKGPTARDRLRAAAQAAAHGGPPLPADRAQLVRVIDYTVTNRPPDQPGNDQPNDQPIRLITTLLDPGLISAAELAAAYAQRWEHENALDELKTHLRGGGQVLRSKTPQLIEQELYGLLLAHYAVRELLCQAADQAGEDPDRLSLLRAIRLVRRQVTDQAAFSP
jgi:Insertion element 4 transposase N-terminal/Transposase DDE domain